MLILLEQCIDMFLSLIDALSHGIIRSNLRILPLSKRFDNQGLLLVYIRLLSAMVERRGMRLLDWHGMWWHQMDQPHRIRTSAWAASACIRRLQRASAVEFPHLLGIGDRRYPCAVSPRYADAAACRAADSVTYLAPVGGISTDRLVLARGHCSRPPSPSARSPLRATDFAGI